MNSLSDMAAVMKREEQIADCLNSRYDINLGGIAPNYNIKGLIADYFLEDDEQDLFLDEAGEEFEGKFFSLTFLINVKCS